MVHSMINFFKNLIQKPEKIFLVFCLFWGIILAFVNPPFQNFDEPEHFFKIYAFSDGTLNFKRITSYTDGTFYFDKPKTFTAQVIPISIVQLVVQSKRMNPYFDENKMYNEGTKTSVKEIINSSNIQLDKHLKTIIIHPIPSYTIFSYFLSVCVMFLLKICNTNPLYMMYLMRLCSLFLYTGLIYYAIKITPVKKSMFLVLALMPSALYLAGAINTDYMIIGLSFLFLAYCLKLAFSSEVEKISKRQFLKLSICAILISISKFVYTPLILLFLIIPKEKFDSQKQRMLYFLSLLVISFLTISCFLYFNLKIFENTFSYYSTNSHIEMLTNLFHNPLSFLALLTKTILFYGTIYLKNSISDFGFSDTNVPSLIIYFYLILIGLVSIEGEKEEYNIDIRKKSLFLFIFVFSLFLIFTANYLNFALEPTGMISGFKGRYLLPVYPLLFLSLYNTKLYFKKFKPVWITLFYLLFFLVIFIFAIIFRYYTF